MGSCSAGFLIESRAIFPGKWCPPWGQSRQSPTDTPKGHSDLGDSSFEAVFSSDFCAVSAWQLKPTRTRSYVRLILGKAEKIRQELVAFFFYNSSNLKWFQHKKPPLWCTWIGLVLLSHNLNSSGGWGRRITNSRPDSVSGRLDASLGHLIDTLTQN